MPTVCAVLSCKKVHSKNDGLHYFRFPKEEQLKQKWINLCGRENHFDVKNARVCSKHFLNDDFENLLQFELMGSTLRLKKDVVPSQNLGAQEQGTEQSSESDHFQRYQRILHKQVVEGLLKTTPELEEHAIPAEMLEVQLVTEQSSAQFESFKSTINREIVDVLLQTESVTETATETQPVVKVATKTQPVVKTATKTQPVVKTATKTVQVAESATKTVQVAETATKTVQDPKPHIYKFLNENLKVEIESLKKENKLLVDRIIVLEAERNAQREKLKAAEVENTCLNLAQTVLQRQNERSNNRNKELNDALSSCFTQTQLDVLLNRKKRVRWSQQDIVNAFTLRYISMKGFLYLKDTLHYPLPGLSTLQQWASKVSLKNGLFVEIIQMLGISARKMSEINKLAVLQLGEMKVAEKSVHDVEADSISESYKYIQVVQVRSLFGNWKQPIYFNLDQKITKEALFELVSALLDIDITVVACVSDCGPTNRRLWTTLNVTASKPWINHPNGCHKIYFFADASHTLKLVRNWLLDNGFDWNGRPVTTEPISSLLKSKKEVTSEFKFTTLHLECKGAVRQRLKLATELLSRTISESLKNNIPNKETEIRKIRRETTAEFVQIVNDWFDVMTSSYGAPHNFQKQEEVLRKMVNMMQSTKCNGKKDLQVIQNGILMSINSLKSLFSELKVKYSRKFQFIETQKLNRDDLENLFAQLSIKVGSEDPTPLDVMKRLKQLILGKSIQSKANTTERVDDEEYVVGELIRTLPSRKRKSKSTKDNESEKDETDNLNNSNSELIGEELLIEPYIDCATASATDNSTNSQRKRKTSSNEMNLKQNEVENSPIEPNEGSSRNLICDAVDSCLSLKKRKTCGNETDLETVEDFPVPLSPEQYIVVLQDVTNCSTATEEED